MILEEIFQISCLIYYFTSYKNFQALSFYVLNTIICYFEGEVNQYFLVYVDLVNNSKQILVLNMFFNES